MLEHTKRQVKVPFFYFPKWVYISICLISTVRFLFFLKLRWPKNKSIYYLVSIYEKTCLVFPDYEGRLCCSQLSPCICPPGLLVFQHCGKLEDPGDKVAIRFFFSTEPEF